MKALLAALLLPALSFAAGYPPGSYSFTGLGGPPVGNEYCSPNGFDFNLWFTWDGGNTPPTFEPGVGIHEGSLAGGWSTQAREGALCGGDSSVLFSQMYEEPYNFILDIENGLLNGIRTSISGAGDPLRIEVDFAEGTFFSSIVYVDTYGTLDRAPGYVEDPLLTPEPATWTLLLLGVGAIAARRRRGPVL